MNVALEITSISDKNSVRGVGTYAQNLIDALKLKKGKVSVSTFTAPHAPNIDLIHYPSFDLYFHKLPIRKRQPRVVTVHDVIPLVFPEHYPVGPRGKANYFLQKLALKNTDGIITDSQTSKSDIANLLKYPSDKIHIVYLAPSKDFKLIKNENILSNIQKKYNLPQKYFLYVGDVNWNKNVEGLLKAVKNTNISTVLVGKALADDTLEPVKSINKQIKELEISANVSKIGYVPNKDLCAIYNLAQATIIPSYYEGFGFAVLESMACGTPVICANNSSLAEIAGSSAIQFDVNTQDGMTSAINKFLSFDDKQIETIGKKSLEHAQKYSWDKVAEETINVYKEVLGK